MHLMVKNDQPVITRPHLEYKKMHLKENKQIKYEKIFTPPKIFTLEKYSPLKNIHLRKKIPCVHNVHVHHVHVHHVHVHHVHVHVFACVIDITR